MPGVSYNQGDIVLLPFPFSDLTDKKPRPAIIISNKLIGNLPDIICAQITSRPRKDNQSFEIKDSDVSTSLGGYSEIRCHKIFTASKTIVLKKISHLHATSHKKFLKKITEIIELK